MAQLTLVVGGVRSGKSRWAEELAGRHPPVVYLATARPGDAEMAERIARHRQRRPADWQTVEEPWDLAAAIEAHRSAGCILLDCLTLWLTNRLLGLDGRPASDDASIRHDLADLLARTPRLGARVVIVSHETGCGIIPADPLARRFGDLLGEANQRVSAAADAVYWCVAGIPMAIKGPGPTGPGT